MQLRRNTYVIAKQKIRCELQMNSGNLFRKKTICKKKTSIYNGRLSHKCSWMRTGVILVELMKKKSKSIVS